MQIQALNCRCPKPQYFTGVKASKESHNEPKEMTNEEVLQLAKARMERPKPSFTPKQKAILPIVDEFNNSGIVDIMNDYFEDADAITKFCAKSDYESDSFEEDGVRYSYQKINIPDENGYNITITAQDDDGEELYSYTSKVRGGYSKHFVKSEFEDFGKVELRRLGNYGSSSVFVNNGENEGYYFAGDVNDDNEVVVNTIMNFR